jgi:nicotinate-nucleotide adenylyltransferase
VPESTPLLIVYGGAFDPPHQGHVDCLRLTAQRFLEATFLVAPAFDPAGAAGQHKRTKVSFSDRIRLCQLAFDAEKTGIEAHRLTVSPIEAELPSPNYTIQTLESVASRNPGVRLCFLVGQDQLESFHQWHRPLEILKIASLIVVKRDTTTGYGGLLRTTRSTT